MRVKVYYEEKEHKEIEKLKNDFYIEKLFFNKNKNIFCLGYLANLIKWLFYLLRFIFLYMI